MYSTPKILQEQTNYTVSTAYSFMSVIQTLLESPVFLICCSILMFWIFDAIAWHWIVPYSTLAINVNAAFKPPSLAHLFGTDNYGRDVFSRVLAGAQSVLSVGGFGALIGVAAGTIVALVAGYYKGVVDGILMRLSNIVLAIPIIVFAAMAAGMLGSSVLTAVIVIGFIFTPNSIKKFANARYGRIVEIIRYTCQAPR